VRSDALTELSGAAVAILAQSYSNLPDTSKEQESARQKELVRGVRRRFGRVTWQIFIGALPIAAVMAVRLTSLEVPLEAFSALTTLSVGWLVIKLLGAIDPNYKETLAEAQAIASEIRGGSK